MYILFKGRADSSDTSLASLCLTLLTWMVLEGSNNITPDTLSLRLKPLQAVGFFCCTLKEMTSPVSQAMLDAYVLMVLVMGTFFLYFCGMVWAFCNPKLSGDEEECGTGRQVVGSALCPSAAEEVTRSTYVNFWDDTL